MRRQRVPCPLCQSPRAETNALHHIILAKGNFWHAGDECYNSAMPNDSQSSRANGPTIAIDGPVASGKSSVGRAVAQHLNLRFLDTGVMYRAVTWLALRQGISIRDVSAIEKLAMDCTMAVGYGGAEPAALITIDGHGLSQELAATDVDRSVSAVAAASGVRQALVRQQRAIGADGSIVMAGRDIGSVVLPDADVKLYIDASVAERARRRWRQQVDTDPAADYRNTLADTIRRDKLDSQRSDSPLTVADGALVINTDGNEFLDTVCIVVAAVCRATGLTLPPVASEQ